MIKYPAMSAWRIAFGVLAWVLSVAGCTSRNPIYCGDGVCVDPAFPFCDIDGRVAGQPNTCIAVTCAPSTFVACRGDQAITCDSTGANYEVVQCEQGCSDGDGGCSICSSEKPCVTVQVAPAGTDANDGFTVPVRTLKRAIGIAAAYPQVTRIELAAGRYNIVGGETYPYVVPSGVTVAGPTEGGAVLVGTTAEAGLMVGDAELVDLELEDFSVAITSTGTSKLSNVRIRTSAVGLRGETGARVSAHMLDIAGNIGGCTTGIELFGDAALDAANLVTHAVGSTLIAVDESTADILEASAFGTASCTSSHFVFRTSSAITVRDSVLDGARAGVSVQGEGEVALFNTVIRNATDGAMGGGRGAKFVMDGGELNNNGTSHLLGGTWSYSNVAITVAVGRNAFYTQGENEAQQVTLIMRNCAITGNAPGIYLFSFTIADLGTAASPGNNVFRPTGNVGLFVDGIGGASQVDAVGNLWKPGAQGADGTGRYPVTELIPGPIPEVSSNNYFIASGRRLLR